MCKVSGHRESCFCPAPPLFGAEEPPSFTTGKVLMPISMISGKFTVSSSEHLRTREAELLEGVQQKR